MSKKIPPSNDIKPLFHCERCDYSTGNKKDFTKHTNTMKHQKKVDDWLLKVQYYDLMQNEPKHKCSHCGQIYKDKSGLWRHKKKCQPEPQPKPVETASVSNDMIMKLMEQNHELQKQILELAKNQSVIHNTNSNNNTTTNNQFNLHLFLNETCKDALNISEFVNSLQLQLKDFETTGRIGYVEGISRIIVNGLKQIDVHKRPIHCTDIKRETVYIKDQDAWEKENPEKNKLKSAVNRVARMNLNQLSKWQEANPDCVNINTKENDDYIQLSLAALGGRCQEEDEKYMDKIMKNVLREVVLDKTPDRP